MGRFPRVVAWLEKQCSAYQPLAEIYGKPYAQVLRRELDLAGVGPDDVLLQVGCGSVPFSAVWAARHTGCRVLALDSDPAAVEKARRLVRRWGLQDSIEVLRLDAARRVPAGFTAAHLSLQAAPKDQILARIAEAVPGAPVVVRQPRPGLEGTYGALPAHCPVVDWVEQPMGTFPRSLLLDPAGSSNRKTGPEVYAS